MLARTAAGKWTWVDFPDSACDDGSATGIGVNPGTTNNLIVFLNGGGACWDAQSCLVTNTSAHGPFGGVQFNQIFGGGSPQGSAFDRTAPDNPFATWSMVFVPYCTGDVHAGDNVVTYTAGATTKTFHHTGHRNFVAFLRRLAVTFEAPAQVVLTGSSAGGFGAAFNYDTFRATWPGRRAR